jgi:hypothetical protein
LIETARRPGTVPVARFAKEGAMPWFSVVAQFQRTITRETWHEVEAADARQAILLAQQADADGDLEWTDSEVPPDDEEKAWSATEFTPKDQG